MQNLIERLVKLIDVKSIVTLALTASFVAQVATNGVNEHFMTIYTMIMGFYFGTQAMKTN